MQNKIQSLLDKIALKSHKIGEIAQDLAYGVAPFDKYSHFIVGDTTALAEELFYKREGTVHKAFTFHYSLVHAGSVWIYSNPMLKKRTLRFIIDATNAKPLEFGYIDAMESDFAKPKLVIARPFHYLKCQVDKDKHFLFSDAIYLRFKPEITVSQEFAAMFLQSKICYFQLKHTRKNIDSIATEDLEKLWFPQIPTTTQEELLPILKTLLFRYEVIEAEKRQFWLAFYQYFSISQQAISHLADTFFCYSWVNFWKAIEKAHKKLNPENVEVDKTSAKKLHTIFHHIQFKLQAMQKETQLIENEINRVLYAFYDLGAEEIQLIEKG